MHDCPFRSPLRAGEITASVKRSVALWARIEISPAGHVIAADMADESELVALFGGGLCQSTPFQSQAQ